MTVRFDEALPPAFDPAFYRAAHPGLGLADDRAAEAHHRAEGRARGLAGSPLAHREGLLAAVPTDGPALEIGPFCQPLLHGGHVEYLDRLDAAGLRARADALGLDTAGCPPLIHHIGGLDAVPAGRFGAVLASHALEHQPDLVRHLEAVARVLRPGGRYWLVLPDKRFCFDHFVPESTVADVLDAWHEERRVHALGSVVEHAALATHNDPARHWRGDHGGVDAAERARRAAEALAAHRRSDGGYLDVHAWQFTPDGFAALMETLARLGLSAFEVERVWDTPQGRGEFCAVLRRARPAPASARRDHGVEARLLQTADPFRYAPMLAVTRPNVTEYARRWGLGYQAFVGVKRGRWNWQATFNRIVMLDELVREGARGWAVYLDADAYVRDLDFDLPAYLDRHRDRAAIFATSGMSDRRWDVNAGVALVNLDHAAGRALVRAWAARFAAVPDERLAAWREWEHAENDQDMLHGVLRDEPAIADAVRVESMGLLNSAHARFVRQRLRAQFDGMDGRLSALKDEVAAVAAAFGVGEAATPPDPGGRAAARLLHHPEAEAWLAEAPPGRAGQAAAAATLAAWRAAGGPAGAAQDALLGAALRADDAAGVAAVLAGLGGSPVARGLLGGDRQHRRAAEDAVFARARAQRTHDALLSLAELVGAVPLENPDLGPWGRTRRLAAPALFARLEETLGLDLSPPPTIGTHLGIEVGRGLVLHLRMVEAMFQTWRAEQVAASLGLGRVAEFGGGVGLGAWYARRLGLSDYRLVAPPFAGVIQAGVLAPLAPPVPVGWGDGPVDLLVADELSGWPAAQALAWLAEGAARGARALLGWGHEAHDPGAPAPPLARLAAEAGGWRRVGRARHGLRPGHLEELFVRAG